MVHLNGHLLCSMDVETTGLREGYNEILQVCFLPLNAQLEPREDLPVYDICIKPLRPDRIDYKSMSVNKLKLAQIIEEGYEPSIAFDLFEHWYSRLKIPEGKRIMPLAQNWIFDRGHLMHWMGWENFNHYIDSRARDTMTVANYFNDRSDFHGNQTPFPKRVKLRYLATQLGIEIIQERLHDALYDCLLTAQVYKAMCKEEFF